MINGSISSLDETKPDSVHIPGRVKTPLLTHRKERKLSPILRLKPARLRPLTFEIPRPYVPLGVLPLRIP